MAVKKKTGLGRGLEALLAPEETPQTAVQQLSILEIDVSPYQPRRVFEPGALEALTESVREHGVLQPIVVRPAEGRYQLVAGERRWRAARAAGLEKIPALVREMSARDAAELALVENIQREDLSPLEAAAGIRELMEHFSYTQEQAAQRLGMDRSALANLLRLLKLPEPVRKAIAEGKLTPGHGKVLAGVKEEPRLLSLFAQTLKNGWSVRQLEEAAAAQQPERKPRPPKPRLPEISAWERDLQEYLGARVKVEGSLEKGTIRITYTDRDTLEQLFEKLK